MKIISKDSPDFTDIEELLGENQSTIQIEMVAGLECDGEDLANQRDAGDNDPIAILELVAQWNPNVREGILDWYYVRESDLDEEEPPIVHGGALLGFHFQGDEPDLDALMDAALEVLNEEIAWAEFVLEEESEEA
ncbi:hypothetical protein Rhal01_00465 [Rubritalea halochordaticola]|uniref:Uncharacterized protein n=1 Tax=Rubritalea halochordaticola TaxID=714537 RepID=A0ABP9UX80_9BACT